MHQFFYSPPDPLNRYLRFIREHRIKIKILHWDCILFTEFKASYILQLFQTILTFIPPNDTKLKWSLTRYIFDKRTTRFYPSLDPQNRNLNQNRTPFSFSPFPPPPLQILERTLSKRNFRPTSSNSNLPPPGPRLGRWKITSNPSHPCWRRQKRRRSGAGAATRGEREEGSGVGRARGGGFRGLGWVGQTDPDRVNSE